MPADSFDAAAKNRDLGTSRWQLSKAVSGTYISGKDVGRGWPARLRPGRGFFFYVERSLLSHLLASLISFRP